MPKKKFRKHRKNWFSLIKTTSTPVKRNKQRREEPPEKCRHSFPLSVLNEDRITYVYKYLQSKQGRNIVQISCVSYEIFVANSWKTIVYYDDAHGEFHRHVMVTINDTKGNVSTLGVRQKGGRRKLLDWAIKDITRNHIYYKREFLKRNRQLLT